MRTHLRTVAAMVALAVFAVACDGGGSTDTTAPTGSDTTTGPGGGDPGDAVLYIADGSALWRVVPGEDRTAVVENLALAFQAWALGGLIWVAESQGRLIGVNPDSGSVVVESQIGESINEIAVDDTHAWALVGFIGVDAKILKIDRSSGDITATVIPPEGSYFSDVEVGEGAVWAIGGNPENLGYISRIEPATATVTATYDSGVFARRIVPGFGSVWVIGDEYSNTGGSGLGLVRLNPANGDEEARIHVADGRGIPDLAIGYNAVWLTDTLGAAVVRVDPSTNEVVTRVNIGQPGQDLYELDMAGGLVWAGNPFEGRIYSIDPVTNESRQGLQGAATKGVAFGQ